jgi:pSer/pThr/pTyr-binding forkhead associated (FHA) protein
MILISIAHDGTGYPLRTFTFTRDTVVIGRAPDADLVLDKEGVAPRHVGISRRDGELVVEDLRTRVERLPSRSRGMAGAEEI